MEYMKVSQAAEKWGISARRVRTLCAAGKIEGVIRKGNLYMIPLEAGKPQDGRYTKINLSEKTIMNAVNMQNNMSSSLMRLSETVDSMEQVKTSVLSPQLQELAVSMQNLSSAIISVMQNDAMQAVVNIGQQIANLVATVDFKPMLKSFSEAMIPLRYIALLRRLKWPVYLIDSIELREKILNVCADEDDLEAVSEIIYAHCTDELFVAMEMDWLNCSIVSDKRKAILSEGMLMHREKHYYASTSMFMCQVYGVAADIEKALQENGFVLNEEEKKDAADMFGLNLKYIDKEKGKLFQTLMFTENGILLWNAMAEYLKDICLFSGVNYSDIDNQPLRNKICHGDQLDFGTKEHSLKAILVIDMLVQLAYEINRIISIQKEEKDLQNKE